MRSSRRVCRSKRKVAISKRIVGRSNKSVQVQKKCDEVQKKCFPLAGHRLLQASVDCGGKGFYGQADEQGPILRYVCDDPAEFWTLWEERLAHGLANGLAVLRTLATEKLAADRLTLASRDALYMSEAVTEHHIYLTTHPGSL